MAKREVTEAKMFSQRCALVSAGILLGCALTPRAGRADEPKPTPENTIHIGPAADANRARSDRTIAESSGPACARCGFSGPGDADLPFPFRTGTGLRPGLFRQSGIFSDGQKSEDGGVARGAGERNFDRQCGGAEEEHPEKRASEYRRGAGRCGEKPAAGNAIERSGDVAAEE